MRVWVRWSVWLCLSLMLWTAAAESTHHHPNQIESASCRICAAAHGASPAITSVNQAPVFVLVGLLREELVVVNARFDFSEAGIRGPPALL